MCNVSMTSGRNSRLVVAAFSKYVTCNCILIFVSTQPLIPLSRRGHVPLAPDPPVSDQPCLSV